MKRKLLAILFVLLLATQTWGAASAILDNSGKDQLAGAFNTIIGGGTIKLYTAAYGTLLATLTIPAAGSNTVSSNGAGTVTLGAIAPVLASGGSASTAALYRIYDASNNLIQHGDVSTSGATINLSATAVTTGQSITITSAVLTVQPGS